MIHPAPPALALRATLVGACALLVSSLGAPAATAQSAPRIAPVDTVESELNVVKTLGNHPQLSEAWLPFAGHVLRGNSLPERDRELLILRVAWNYQAEYEWGHHSRLGRSVGLSDDEILRITQGPDAGGWSSFDRGLLRAVDQLQNDAFINDYTWGTLKARYTDQQMMDLVFTVGQYTLVSMALKSFGVQREEGVEGFPADSP